MKRSALTMLAVAASALGTARADPRVISHFFHDGEVVAVHGHSGLQSTIAFAADERIENVAVGDAALWQVVPNKRADLIFVRPLKPGARTNMTVVTDRHTYLFDLESSAAAPVYLLTFTYPVPPPAPIPLPGARALAEIDTPPAAVTAPPQPNPADLNFAWDRKGAKALLPERAYDDGHSTYLSWPHDTPLPAILTRSPTGTEGPVNYTVHGDVIVVDGVPGELILRSGKQMAVISPAVPASRAPVTRQRVTPSLPESSSVPTPIRLPQQTASSTP